MKPTLAFKDLVILVIIGVFIFVSAGVNDAFEISMGWYRKYEVVEVGELIILSLILAFAFVIFSLWKWRELKREMVDPKWAEEEIKKPDRGSIKERDEFLWIVSRDLGVPVRNISDMAASIIRKHGEIMDDELKERLTRIERNGEHELGLIQGLLKLSRTKTEMERFEEVNLGELDRGVRDGFSHELEGKGSGLSAVKAIVESFGGRILVEFPAEEPRKGRRSKGSTFPFTSAKGVLREKDG